MLSIPLCPDESSIINVEDDAADNLEIAHKPHGKTICVTATTLAQSARDSLLEWWTTVSSSEFLNSKASRRGVMRSLAFPLMCVNIFVDTVNYSHGGIPGTDAITALLLEAVLLVFSFFFRCIPKDWLLPDVGAIIGLGVYAFLLLGSLDTQGLDTWLGYVACMPSALFVFGWHSSCILLYQVILLSWLYIGPRATAISPVSRYSCSVYSLFCLSGVLVCEYWLAQLVKDVAHKSDANERLLQRTTDGFGTIDATTGTILSASPSLARSLVCGFNGDALVGRNLADFLDRSDALQLQCLQGLNEGGMLDVQPLLFKFNQLAAPCILKPLASFDAMLIAHASTDTTIEICIKRVGEARPMEATKKSIQMVGGISSRASIRAAPSSDGKHHMETGRDWNSQVLGRTSKVEKQSAAVHGCHKSGSLDRVSCSQMNVLMEVDHKTERYQDSHVLRRTSTVEEESARVHGYQRSSCLDHVSCSEKNMLAEQFDILQTSCGVTQLLHL